MVQTVALAALLAAVLMVASCVGIVNAFGTNLNDRKRQIGMLAHGWCNKAANHKHIRQRINNFNSDLRSRKPCRFIFCG